MKFLISVTSLFLSLLFGSLTYAQSCGSGGGATICLSATGSVDNIALTWTVAGAVDAIQVYRDTDSNPKGSQRLAMLNTSERSYTDTSAAAGTQYWYWIKFRADKRFYNSGAVTAVREGDNGNSSIYPNYNINPLPANMTGMSSNAVDIANNINLGFNIGNSLEAIGGETYWGNPMITADFVSLLKQSGFNAIRLPASWDQYADQTTAEIDLSWLARVREVVQYCVDNDLYVIVNIHWDGGWLDENIVPEKQSETNDKQRAYWQQIATYLRDFDEHLMFASANEPPVDNAEQMSVLMSYHQTFVDAVRETGGRNAYRVLVVQGPLTDITKTNELMTEMPVDTVSSRMMAEIHFYTPWNFTGMTEDETWGNQFYYWGAGNHSTTDTAHNPTWGEEDELNALFSLMKTQFVDQGIPVVMGEFGAIRRPEQVSGDDLTLHLKSRADFHRFVTQQGKAHGMLPFYWDNGIIGNFGFGIFDRATNTVADQQTLDALVQGASN